VVGARSLFRLAEEAHLLFRQEEEEAHLHFRQVEEPNLHILKMPNSSLGIQRAKQ